MTVDPNESDGEAVEERAGLHMVNSSLLTLCFSLKRFQVLANDDFDPLNEFINPGISVVYAAPPADHSTVDGTRHHRLV